MFKKIPLIALLVLIFVLTACNVPTVVPTAVPNTAVPPLPTIAPTQTQVQLPTVEASGTPTIAQTLAPGTLPDISAPKYLDDRSTPAALMSSYFNALNRQEFLRAYSYYQNTSTIGTFDEFSKGYADLKSVSIVFGQITKEGAAGSIYYTVPMVLNFVQTSGTQEKSANCYIIQLPQPGNYGAPPITPMSIDRGVGKIVPVSTSDTDALASACTGPDYPIGPNTQPATIEQMTDLSDANYIDNRSDPVSLLSSLLNAINKQEYVRAYSYWQTPPETYQKFSEGYAQTAKVSAQFGQVIDDPGAGQLNYSVPVKMIATLKDGTLQTFVGCYFMHLAQPANQATPPFVPLGITKGKIMEVANNSDVNPLMMNICQQ